jgi:hypothetical protein
VVCDFKIGRSIEGLDQMGIHQNAVLKI